MKKLPITSLKTLVAIAALSLLTAAKQGPTPAPAPDPTPADAVYEADACPGSVDDTIEKKRVKLIRGMI